MKLVLPSVEDPLADALHFLRMSGIFYSRSECRAPWGLALPAMPGFLMLHAVTSGQCWLIVDGAPKRLLRQGELALVPHGEGHRLASDPLRKAVNLFDIPRQLSNERYEVLRLDGGGAPATLVCGVFQFDHPAAQLLLPLLPKTIAIDAIPSPHLEWIHSTLHMMAAEAREPRAGSETVITRLADILVILAIRSWMIRDPTAQTGWLGALRDKQIGRILAGIHREPASPWTLESLAAQAAMSRSAFSSRFTELVGEPAMRYVTRWRMYHAWSLLREEETTVGDLSGRLGYESEAAFSRAFKRYLGVSPGAVRKGGHPRGVPG